jgi:citrate lyase subunit beta/citryl-CoA lyase
MSEANGAGALLWRSLLYVPANVERFIDRAHTRGADGIILDLEDSVPPSEKAAARDELASSVARAGQAGADVLVRVNRPLELAVPDIEAAVAAGVRGLFLPKLAGPDHVRLIADLVDGLEARHGVPAGHTLLCAMIETADAFLSMPAIAGAHPRVAALMIGGEDIALDLGMAPDPETLRYPKQQSVIAARAAGVMPLGLMGTVADYQDAAAVRLAAETAKRFGMEGATCIHPSVVPVLNKAFSPSEAEVSAARRTVEAYDEATATGRGSLEVDGKMVDVPVVERAQRLLARAALVSKHDARG